MKRISIVMLMLISLITFSVAQDTLAGWTFPTGTEGDAYPDFGILVNSGMTITTQGGTSTIDFSKNGFTSKAAHSTGWESGKDLKYWQIEINTSGYKNIQLSSMQTSGGANPGPRDFKAQYKSGVSGTWTDIPGAVIITANNWTSGLLSNVKMSSECNDQSSVFIRWIMTTDTSSSPPAFVLSSGTAKIDNIFITGLSLTGEPEPLSSQQIIIFPNPCEEKLFINTCHPGEGFTCKIYTTDGSLVKSVQHVSSSAMVWISDIPSGNYYIRIEGNNISITKKIIKW